MLTEDFQAIRKRLGDDYAQFDDLFVNCEMCFHALGDLVVILNNLKAGRIAIDDVDLSMIPSDFLTNQTKAARSTTEGHEVDGEYFASCEFITRVIGSVAPRMAKRWTKKTKQVA